MKTILASQVSNADRPFICSRGNGDGKVTLYYPGDDIPELPTVIAAPTKMVTAQEFRDLFTTAELLGMIASADNGVRLLLFKVQTNISGIDLLGTEAQQGLAYLVSKALLAAGRPAQISG